MRIRVLSDLHLEFMARNWRRFVRELPNDCDVLVLAGDVTSWHPSAPTLSAAYDAFCERFERVVTVLGNHEYYGSSPVAVHQDMTEAADRHKQLAWLHRSSVTIDGLRFIGTSLWFARDPNAPTHELNDFYQIQDFAPWVYEENRRDREFIETEAHLADVVVTHHLPSHRSVHPKYAGNPLNAFFVCDVEPSMPSAGETLWVHGHTHDSCDYRVGGTRVVCNPYGYAGHEVNGAFDPCLTIELPTPSGRGVGG